MALLYLLDILNTSYFLRVSLSGLSLPESSVAGVGSQSPVPPAKTCGEVVYEGLVVKIVVVSASPEGDEFVETPREVVSAVGVNGLEQSTEVSI